MTNRHAHHLVYGGLAGILLHFAPVPYSGLLGTAMLSPLVFHSWSQKVKVGQTVRLALADYGRFITDVAGELASDAYRETVTLTSEFLGAPAIAEMLIAEKQEGVDLDTDWINHIVTINPATERATTFGIIGSPGDGKTYLANQLFLARAEAVPDGDMYLFDFSHTPDKYLPFMRSPSRYTANVDEFANLLKSLAKRIKSGTPKPFFLFADEINNAFAEMSDKQQEQAVDNFNTIRRSGGKHNSIIAFTTHDVDVNQSGMPQGIQKSLPWVIFQGIANDDQDWHKLGISAKRKAQFEALVDEMGDYQLPDKTRLCILKTPNGMSIHAVPDRGDLVSAVVVVDADDQTKDQITKFMTDKASALSKWKGKLSASQLTRNDDFQSLFQENFDARLTRKDSDPRYAVFKQIWEQEQNSSDPRGETGTMS